MTFTVKSQMSAQLSVYKHKFAFKLYYLKQLEQAKKYIKEMAKAPVEHRKGYYSFALEIHEDLLQQ